VNARSQRKKRDYSSPRMGRCFLLRHIRGSRRQCRHIQPIPPSDLPQRFINTPTAGDAVPKERLRPALQWPAPQRVRRSLLLTYVVRPTIPASRRSKGWTVAPSSLRLGAVLAAPLGGEAQHMGKAGRGTGSFGATKRAARWALPWGRNRSIARIPD